MSYELADVPIYLSHDTHGIGAAAHMFVVMLGIGVVHPSSGRAAHTLALLGSASPSGSAVPFGSASPFGSGSPFAAQSAMSTGHGQAPDQECFAGQCTHGIHGMHTCRQTAVRQR